MRTNLLKSIGTVLLLGATIGVTHAGAQSLQNVNYVGGTALPGTGLHGKVLVSSTDALVFEGSSKLAIPYARIMNYESKPHKEIHVGLLTEGLWRLLAPWPEGKQLSLSYTDADEHAQVIVLQMSRADEALLVEVLKTRVPRGGYHPGGAPPHPVALLSLQEKTADR